MSFDPVKIENRQIYAVCTNEVKQRFLEKRDFLLKPIIGWCFNPNTLGWEPMLIHYGEIKAISAISGVQMHDVTFDQNIEKWTQANGY
jgi:hypothetical protein